MILDQGFKKSSSVLWQQMDGMKNPPRRSSRRVLHFTSIARRRADAFTESA
jgi:hypothetical protein